MNKRRRIPIQKLKVKVVKAVKAPEYAGSSLNKKLNPSPPL